MNNSQLAKQIEKLASQIALIAKSIQESSGEYPPVPEFAKKLAEEGRCLGCKEPIEGRPVRGLDQKHFKALTARIKEGKITEFEAIEKGLMLPPAVTGRKPKEDYEQMFSSTLRVAENQPEETTKRQKKPKASRPPAKE